MGSNYYKKGCWNVICDVCGFQYKSDQVLKRWDGMIVCKKDYEVRHPQDFLRVREDSSNVPFTRPEGEDTFIEPNSPAAYVNFLSKWPYTQTYANLDGVSVAGVALGSGGSVTASHLTALGSSVSFSTTAPTHYPYEDVYETVRTEHHTDFHPKFMAAAVGAAFSSVILPRYNEFGMSGVPGPVSYTMPTIGTGFKVGVIESTPLTIYAPSQIGDIVQYYWAPLAATITIGTSTLGGDGRYTPSITSDITIDGSTRYIAGTDLYWSFGDAYGKENEIFWMPDLATHTLAAFSLGSPLYKWNGSSYDVVACNEYEIGNNAATIPTSYTPPVYTNSISDGDTTISNHTATGTFALTASSSTTKFTYTDNPWTYSIVPQTIPSLDVTHDTGIVGYGGSLVCKVTGFPQLMDGSNGNTLTSVSAGAGTALTSMGEGTSNDRAWGVNHLNDFQQGPSIAGSFHSQYRRTGGGYSIGYLTVRAPTSTLTFDHRYRSNPGGDAYYTFNGATGASTRQITIHWPQLTGYGLCVFTVPSDYATQLAGMSAAARLAYQQANITVLLNNFASFELMSSIHEVGEYAIFNTPS